ncbi:Tol-Pal system beta propeller repeat protein TolB [Suttonella sp. R2A3]|uniref:Tol-Pal system beta propeller repeat protein TolB n=1 Tax=Suttonella sp. R2A3 TaxID=2908648 RepID=UPI001F177FB6|nr:Tol-Pal system beta propeller repeat protein TolB [Suttonella sp. R2A3]UJF24416.1 Tol-Pal system beta propeller repeat protein TolB [Suttonella sp. R2A3]
MMRQWLLAAACVMSLPLQAQVVVNVSGAQRAAQPIAVLPFTDDNGAKIDYIISTDLYKSGVLQPIDPSSLNMRPNSPQEIDYDAFRQKNIDYLSLGRMQGSHEAQFVLSDVTGREVLLNDRVKADNDRQLAHEIADRILEELTGKRGAFATKIAYILEQDKGDIRRYSLMVSDMDGANRREVVSSNQPILSPTWSPDGRNIAYMTYADNRSQIVVQDISGGSKRVLVQSDDISSSPAFSPDGRSIAFSQSSNNNPDIYVIDLASGNKMRLTTHAGIDTEPAFSPDGRYVYFTSDRAGRPQIYRISRNGGAAERVVVGNGFAANGDISPDGNSLVLTRQTGGGYQIGLYDLASGRFEALTSGRLDEGASFAPNGQMIVYATREGGRSVLKMINHKGGEALTLADPAGRLRDPAWGPDTRN